MSDDPNNKSPENFLAPHSVEAEEAVLGAILLNPDVMLELATFLDAESFFILRNSWVWEAMARLMERNDVIDYLTVTDELRNQDRLEEIGGSAYITYLINNTPTHLHADAYGRVVERAAIRRRLLGVASEIAQYATSADADVDEVINRSESALFAATERNMKREITLIRDAVSDYFDQIEFLYENQDERLGVPTGFNDLDGLLGGLQKSDLLILAARPGMGKTSFKLNVALNASRLGARVAIFSLEMGNDQIVQRFISSETGINTQDLRLGRLDDEDWGLFVEASGKLAKIPIFLDDTPALTPIQLRTKCRRIHREYGLDLVIVDYLQLMSSGRGRIENRVQEISYISRHLKELARELKVPLLAGAQLSRAVEQRGDKRPLLSDLRESGCLTGDTLITLADTESLIPIRDLVGQSDFSIWAHNETTQKLEKASVSNAFSTGVKPVYRMTTRSGRSIRATANHKFLTINGWKRLDELVFYEELVVPAINLNLHDAPNAQNVYEDSIISIEPDGEEEVFDLTVPKLHNFVANNIIVHNSIEQDADIVMFIYRDDVYNENSERPNVADIIVAKHRNGPTGSISLHWNSSLTKFGNLKHEHVDVSDV